MSSDHGIIVFELRACRCSTVFVSPRDLLRNLVHYSFEIEMVEGRLKGRWRPWIEDGGQGIYSVIRKVREGPGLNC